MTNFTEHHLDKNPKTINKLELTDAKWRERLPSDRHNVLRNEGTEPAGTSELNNEKRNGDYLCAGCGLKLFSKEMKYNSGTGWPSFFKVVEGHITTRTDFKLIYQRKEYHCARCGGHQGHVFNDGPEPTGKRYCNNGLALIFSPYE